LSIYKKNQFAFWNFLGLKTGARFFFSGGFGSWLHPFSLPKYDLFLGLKLVLVFLVVLVSGFIDLSR